MDHKKRIAELLQALAHSGAEGQIAYQYLNQFRVRVSVRNQFTGARWTIFRNIQLSPRYLNPKEELYALSLLVHEVHHLRQGFFQALSVQGELEAWQLQFRFYQTLGTKNRWAVIDTLATLDTASRTDLNHAVTLMRKFAGKKYHANWLPLFPINREIKYWIMRMIKLKN